MDREINNLVCLLLSEGTVRIHRNKASIVFTNTSEELNKIFRESAKRLGHKTFRKSNKQTAIYSKELATALLKRCISFRSKRCSSGKKNACPVTTGKNTIGPSCKECTPFRFKGMNYPPTSFPRSIIESDGNRLAECLRIFFTCDGGVVVGSDPRNDEVILRVGHPILRNQVLIMLGNLGIKAKIRGESLLYIKKRSEMLKYSKLIGFVNGAKSVRGSHKGAEKNKLLELVLKRHGSVQTARQAI